MTDASVLEIGMSALWLATKITAPLLIVALGIGLLVSLLQAVTQIQEVTLTFVPKFVGIALVLAVGGNWMLAEMTSFTTELFAKLPQLLP